MKGENSSGLEDRVWAQDFLGLRIFPHMICASLWLEKAIRTVFLLNTPQLDRIKPYIPVLPGVSRADYRWDYPSDSV